MPGGRSLRIISGGQSGVDRAALDVALALGMPCGGWVPRGRRTEDGPLPFRYPMRESRSAAYAERTRLNVRDSDATLVLCRGTPNGGTALTVACARVLGRSVLIVDLCLPEDDRDFCRWLDQHCVAVLNIAGPRESGCPGIYKEARRRLESLLTADASRCRAR